MTPRIAANRTDRDRLDEAVRGFVASTPRCRAAQILCDPTVLEALSHLPSGKDDFRYVDNALQRLRKAGAIECERGGYWSKAKRGSQAKRGRRR